MFLLFKQNVVSRNNSGQEAHQKMAELPYTKHLQEF